MKERIKRERSGHDVLMMMVVVQHIVIYRCIILVCVCVTGFYSGFFGGFVIFFRSVLFF